MIFNYDVSDLQSAISDLENSIIPVFPLYTGATDLNSVVAYALTLYETAGASKLFTFRVHHDGTSATGYFGTSSFSVICAFTSVNYGFGIMISDSKKNVAAFSMQVANSPRLYPIADKVLYYYNHPVSVATNAQIMRIPSTGTDYRITTDTVVLNCTFENFKAVDSPVTWTSYDGYVAFTGTCRTATTANVILGSKGN